MCCYIFRSWQLDETEGPARVRNRLKRCHLNLTKRFLKTEFQDKLGRNYLTVTLSWTEQFGLCDYLQLKITTLYKIEKLT